MLELTENIFSFCIGGLALISTVVSVTLYCRAYIPNTQIKVLDELLTDTKAVYDKTKAEGLFPSEKIRQVAEKKLLILELEAEGLRESAYKVMTPFEEYIAMLTGLSWSIMRKSSEARKLRSLLTTSSKEQKGLRENPDIEVTMRPETLFALISDSVKSTDEVVRQPTMLSMLFYRGSNQTTVLPLHRSDTDTQSMVPTLVDEPRKPLIYRLFSVVKGRIAGHVNSTMNPIEEPSKLPTHSIPMPVSVDESRGQQVFVIFRYWFESPTSQGSPPRFEGTNAPPPEGET